MAGFVKLFIVAWPFIKDMFKGKNTLIGYIRNHKFETLLIGLNVFALVIFVFMYEQAVSDAAMFHEVTLQNKSLAAENARLQTDYNNERALIETYIQVHKLQVPVATVNPPRPPTVVVPKPPVPIRTRPTRPNQTLHTPPIVR